MKISIVTTVFNIEKFIKRCMDSLVSQTYNDIEIIVVNDCSTDSSMDIIKSYTDERIRIIEHERNMGAGWARRHGIEAATGEYVITIDGDDWISKDFIEKLAKNAEETGADIISGGITIVYPDGYSEIKRFPVKCSTTGKEKFADYANQRIIFLNNKLVRRNMYEQTPYSTRRFCEDTPVIVPLLYYCNMVSYVDTQGYYYLQHGASLCRKVNDFEQALFKALCSAECREFFADKGDEYKNLISLPEFIQYVKIIKATMTDELKVKYQKELGELLPRVLDLLQI